MPSVVVVGTRFGAEAHIPGFKAAGYDVVGLVGRDLAKTEAIAAHYGTRGFAGLDAALAEKPDVVSIASPPHLHYDLAKQALEAGVHVVCEKPFTRTLREAAELRDLAAERGLVGVLCHEFRYVPSTALIGRLLAEGAIGQPRMATLIAHSGYVADVTMPRPDWWFNKELGGGWLGASGSHGIDRIVDWFGDMAGISAQRVCASARQDGSADDSFDLHFRSRSGVIGTFQSTAAAWGPAVDITRVIGPAGTLWLEDTVQRGIIEVTAGPVHISDAQGTRTIAVPPDLEVPPLAVDSRWGHSSALFAQQFREVARLIAGEAPTVRYPRSTTFADGYRNMLVLEAAYRSAARGGEWINVTEPA